MPVVHYHLHREDLNVATDKGVKVATYFLEILVFSVLTRKDKKEMES